MMRDTLGDIRDLRSLYIRDRALFIEGDRMTEVLTGLGAYAEDFEAIRQVSDSLGEDPTLPFRKSKNGRFCFDPAQSLIYRTEFQPFILSAEEDFVRHDSGKVRRFMEVGDDLQLNSAFQAMLVFKFLISKGVEVQHRPGLDYNDDRQVCTLFNLRTVTTPQLTGHPALEGVHSDGVDHTMTTFLGSGNITHDSAITFLHDMREKNSIRWDEADHSLLLEQWQHRKFLDTLLIVDHERKHSLSPVQAVDPNHKATRDMLVFFTRKPTAKGHISRLYDSLRPHEQMPMSVRVPVVSWS